MDMMDICTTYEQIDRVINHWTYLYSIRDYKIYSNMSGHKCAISRKNIINYELERMLKRRDVNHDLL